MCGTSNPDLPLLNEAAGCSCCLPQQETSTESTTRPLAGQQAAKFQVGGMTCGHCVSSVTEELAKLDGVSDVQVALVPDGLSTVTVYSERKVSQEAVRGAVSEAGYDLAGTA
ncbi:MAG: heavy-metal-associated domain-containing protein [Actinomycetota bacterium]